MDKEELKNLEKIKTLSQTEGGQYLISVSKDIVVSTVDILSANYKDMTRDELVSLCAKLNESLGTYKLLTGINDKIESIKKLYE